VLVFGGQHGSMAAWQHVVTISLSDMTDDGRYSAQLASFHSCVICCHLLHRLAGLMCERQALRYLFGRVIRTGR
jgi:hypothetical protein